MTATEYVRIQMAKDPEDQEGNWLVGHLETFAAERNASPAPRADARVEARLIGLVREFVNVFPPGYEYDNNNIEKIKQDRDTLRQWRRELTVALAAFEAQPRGETEPPASSGTEGEAECERCGFGQADAAHQPGPSFSHAYSPPEES